MKKINELMTEQIARIDEWREKWLAIGLSTQPADREGAKQGIIAAYSAANLEASGIFVWLHEDHDPTATTSVIPAGWEGKITIAKEYDEEGDFQVID